MNHPLDVSPSPLCLKYNQAARNWNEALPLGNGRLGAMVYGGTRVERLSLNEDTIWTGLPRDTVNYGAKQHLQEVRDLIFARRHRDAQDVIETFMEGQGCEVYQTAGDLCIRRLNPKVAGVRHWSEPAGEALSPTAAEPTAPWNGVGNEADRLGDSDEDVAPYVRGLDLHNAEAFSTFTLNGTTHRRTCLVSAPHQVLVYRHEAQGGTLALGFSFACPLPHRVSGTRVRAHTRGSGPTLLLEGQCLDSVAENWKHREDMASLVWDDARRGVRFAAGLRIGTDGYVCMSADGKELEVRSATWITAYLAIETTFSGAAAMPLKDLAAAVARMNLRLDTAMDSGFAALRQEHRWEHRRRFDTLELSLGSPAAQAAAAAIPTDQRLARRAQALKSAESQEADPGLAVLLFQYGRYLLLASSRPGTQAANLQGIWNPQILPPWGSEYTTNINTQMNYWPAETCNLSDCAQPLFTLVRELANTGERTALEHYGTRGWCAHHNTDIWRTAAPVDGHASWAFWPMAGAWLSRHLWEHYLFTNDREFLITQAWPALRGSARFLLDWLVRTPSGRLGTCPSTSPENCFLDSQGRMTAVSHSSTMDLSIIRDILGACATAAGDLGIEPELCAEIQGALEQLEPFRIQADGRLAEWDHDLPETEPGHRHVSHLYGVFPANLFDDQPELMAAAQKSLEFRLAHGGGHTGWSCAWLINLWARLGDAKQAGHFVDTLLGRSTYPNLLDAHPPFQIDGNFGATAGIAEMLVQSHGQVIRILPACPQEWNEGSLRGIRARGGLELDFAWKNGLVTALTLRDWTGRPTAPRTVLLNLPVRAGTRETMSIALAAGGEVRVV